MENLRNMKVDELKDIARQYNLVGAWKMTKDKLIESIIKSAELNNHKDKYFDSAAVTEEYEAVQNESELADEEVIEEESQNEPESTQVESKRKQDLIEYNGKTQNLSAWARELGIPGQTLYARLRLSNWPVEKAFTTPTKRKNKEEV